MKVFIFPIMPQTWCRVTQNDSIWFRIPEEEITSKTGLARKRRIERYNEYREEVGGFAKRKKFSLPYFGAAIYFFVPMPIRWPQKKKVIMAGKLHGQKSDLSNLLKAFEDSLTKKDENIGQYTGLGKYWVDADRGAGWARVEIDCPPIADGNNPCFDHNYKPGWNDMNSQEVNTRIAAMVSKFQPQTAGLPVNCLSTEDGICRLPISSCAQCVPKYTHNGMVL